jgi:aryl-phospho-beta-D-glucosidase BglC (GH1 family)
MMAKFTLLTALLSASVQAWMPADRELPAFNRTDHFLDKRAHPIPDWKIRGVNLGGWLISEPWMMGNEWKSMGCSGKNSEFDCVSNYPGGQSAADAAFKTHYNNWIKPSDIQAIHDSGLNTVRIPIGYWSLRSLVASSEHFPNVDLTALDNVIQKAADLGMFVVIDLHGAPGAQKLGDAFTGQVSCRHQSWCKAY